MAAAVGKGGWGEGAVTVFNFAYTRLTGQRQRVTFNANVHFQFVNLL